MDIQIGKKYTHVLRNDDYYYYRKKGLEEKAILYSCEAEILNPPEVNNNHVLSGNMVYAKLTSRKNGRTDTKWIKKSSLVEELI
jgi:hypothetical protein